MAVLAVLAAVLCYAALMFVSGRRPDTEDVIPGPLNPVPFDILAAATAGAVILALYVMDGHGAEEEIIFALILSVVATCLFIGLSMSLACRVKQRTLIRGSFVYRAVLFASGCVGAVWGLAKRVFAYFTEGLRNLSVVWKTVLVFLGFTFLELVIIAAGGGAEESALLLALERFLILPGIVITAAALRKLYKSGQALAAGDLSHYTDTKGMFWDLKRHGEDLNNIAKGMAIAVD
ncbi:MAG: hypothetical protein J6U30_00555, partial [Oscillospiraceae bacterium]|nr:hypothetical protein [Oscillospiraceae bacterium]